MDDDWASAIILARARESPHFIEAAGSLEGSARASTANIFDCFPPKSTSSTTICRLLSSHLKERENTVYITTEYSSPHEKILRGLHDEIPKAKIYLVKPNSLAVDLRLDNLVSLDVPLSAFR
ncbi:hypothetical protein MUP37_06805 [Candidatus Bathyarchaeota archaeon]|nr:hypothetical protein [Candidatus Bathyarchaeota archaeon]